MSSSDWIPRKRRCYTKGEKVCVTLKSLRGASIRLDRSMLKCVVCDEILPRDFASLSCDPCHSLCGACVRGCMKECVITCPVCRVETRGLEQHPIIRACLAMYPRRVPCGEMVEGWSCADAHTKACIKCSTATIEELRKELVASKKAQTTLLNESERMREELDVFRDEQVRFENDAMDSESDN